MRLEYAVLAIDDQPESVASFERAIRDFLGTEGFDLDWTTCDSPARLTQHLSLPDRTPDLVIVDNKLAAMFGGQDGAHWASEIRRKFRYTDIVFYGQDTAGSLRANIGNAGVDGVYCSSRPNLLDDLRDLIVAQIRRWTDGPAMRGLAVGIATELDDLLRQACIDASRHHNKQVRESVYAKVTESVGKRSSDRPERIRQHIEADNFEALFREHTEFTAAELARAIKWLADSIPGASVEEAKTFRTRYIKDIVEPRNVLAHGDFDEQARVFTLNGRTFATTEAACREFRVTLRRYREELRGIRNAAKNGRVFPKG